MILTDYFRVPKDCTWDIARQCGVRHGVVRLPEENGFDVTKSEHWEQVHKQFSDFGIKPVVIEPMPNYLHDHIKAGDEKRDESIDKVIQMFPIMEKLDIRTICFNFMAHIGWTRTTTGIQERGGALVTGFSIKDFKKTDAAMSEEMLWANYTYFIKAVLPYAEKYGITLALHPDDPPLARLGNVSRIMVSADNIERALKIVPSENLGITMCQATYLMMGEDLYKVIPRFKEYIKFIHFRNVKGNKFKFQETFHDNGEIAMGDILRLYDRLGIDVPIRVDHVPTMLGETAETAGYGAMGRLYAIGYLKGLLENI